MVLSEICINLAYVILILKVIPVTSNLYFWRQPPKFGKNLIFFFCCCMHFYVGCIII